MTPTVRYIRFASFVLLGSASMLSKETGITVFSVAIFVDILISVRSTHPLECLRYFFARSTFWTRLQAVLAALTCLVLVFVRLHIMDVLPKFQRHEVPAAFSTDHLTRVMTFNYYVALHARSLVAPIDLCHDWSHKTIPLITQPSDIRNGLTLFFYGTLVFIVTLACAPSKKIANCVSSKRPKDSSRCSLDQKSGQL